MVHKYLSVLLLCFVPLIAMEKDKESRWTTEQKYPESEKIESILQYHILEWTKLSGNREEYLEKARIEGVNQAYQNTKKEQPAPSQVSPCLNIIELYLKKPDTTLPSNAVRDCIRKYVGLFRSNL